MAKLTMFSQNHAAAAAAAAAPPPPVKPETAPANQNKRNQRTLDPREKLQAIHRVTKNGESKASVARAINVPESTLRGWVKNEEKIRNLALSSPPSKELMSLATLPAVQNQQQPKTASSTSPSLMTTTIPPELKPQQQKQPDEAHGATVAVPRISPPRLPELSARELMRRSIIAASLEPVQSEPINFSTKSSNTTTTNSISGRDSVYQHCTNFTTTSNTTVITTTTTASTSTSTTTTLSSLGSRCLLSVRSGQIPTPQQQQQQQQPLPPYVFPSNSRPNPHQANALSPAELLGLVALGLDPSGIWLTLAKFYNNNNENVPNNNIINNNNNIINNSNDLRQTYNQNLSSSTTTTTTTRSGVTESLINGVNNCIINNNNNNINNININNGYGSGLWNNGLIGGAFDFRPINGSLTNSAMTAPGSSSGNLATAQCSSNSTRQSEGQCKIASSDLLDKWATLDRLGKLKPSVSELEALSILSSAHARQGLIIPSSSSSSFPLPAAELAETRILYERLSSKNNNTTTGNGRRRYIKTTKNNRKTLTTTTTVEPHQKSGKMEQQIPEYDNTMDVGTPAIPPEQQMAMENSDDGASDDNTNSPSSVSNNNSDEDRYSSTSPRSPEDLTSNLPQQQAPAAASSSSPNNTASIIPDEAPEAQLQATNQPPAAQMFPSMVINNQYQFTPEDEERILSTLIPYIMAYLRQCQCPLVTAREVTFCEDLFNRVTRFKESRKRSSSSSEDDEDGHYNGGRKRNRK